MDGRCVLDTMIGYLAADAFSNDLVATGPCVPVKAMVQMSWDDLQKDISQLSKVFGINSPLLVLAVQVSKMSSESWLILQQRNQVVKTTQDTGHVSLELRGVNVLTVNTLEKAASITVDPEQFVEHLLTELHPLPGGSVDLCPLGLHLQPVHHSAVCCRHSSQTEQYKDDLLHRVLGLTEAV